LNRPVADAGANTDEGGNMHTMLHDLYGMYDVKEDNYEPQPKVQGAEEHIVDDEPDRVMHKSTRTCLKRQTSHFTIRPYITNSMPLYTCTT
jgi:hypothetical protein